MLGGLAAGLGLAWLAHSLGLGAAFGNILLIALLVAGWRSWLWRMLRGALAQQRRARARAASRSRAPAGRPARAAPAQYSPDNVGNDASARPWERSSAAFDATPAAHGGAGSSMAGAAAAGGGSMIGSALAGCADLGHSGRLRRRRLPDGGQAQLRDLQDAWDRADIPTLRAMMTDDMVGEIRSQLAERESHTGGQPNKTEVVMLEAKLLGIEETGDDYMASVEFSGMIREDASAGPSPFREVWNMTKPPRRRSGWLVAGVQALQ